MKSPSLLSSIVLIGAALLSPAATDAPWPRFRGPNGQGLAPASRIPVQFGPGTNVVERTAVPAGHSSPIALGNASS